MSFEDYFDSEIAGAESHVEHEEVQLVCFLVSGTEYGFPILQVKEIVRYEGLLSLPGLNHPIEGVIDLRSQIIPVMKLAKRFDLNAEEKPAGKIMILRLPDNNFIGAMVDDITKIITVNAAAILNVRQSMMSSATRNIKGIIKIDDKHNIILADAGTLLTTAELDLLKNINIQQSQPEREATAIVD